MAFSNPIVGGGGVLIRDNIQSENFITQISGWIIRRDGTAEFLDVLIRGDLIVGNPTGQRVEVREVSGTPVIRIYDASNFLVGEWSATAFTIQNANGSSIRIEPDFTAGVDGAALIFDPREDNSGGTQYSPGVIKATHGVASEYQPNLVISSPTVDPPGFAAATLQLRGETSGLPTQTFFDSAQYRFTPSPFNVIEDGSSAVLNLALAAAAVPGISIALTIAGPNNAKVHVCGHADAEVLVQNAAVIAVGELVLDGNTQLKQILMSCAMPAGSRMTVGQCWDLSLPTGNHTLTMQGRNTGGGAFARFNATHTNLVATVIDC